MQYTDENMLFPVPVATDDFSKVRLIKGYELFRNYNFPKNGYWHLHTVWGTRYDLPLNYDYYIISWHMEQIDYEWLSRQSVDAPIYVLSDFNTYDNYRMPKNVTMLKWTYWHHALQRMIDWFGYAKINKDIRYKYSAFCNRITQSKMIVTTALLESSVENDLLVSLSDWVEDKNVHDWNNTGMTSIDALKDIFLNKYLGKKIIMDDFDDATQNYQIFTANPWHKAYQQAALHFTNESFHYSLMQDSKGQHIIPGPHLTEKTFKCLLGGTAFIPVGQFDVYRSLQNVGMEFDYGFDLSFDQDPGNLTRLQKILDLIDYLKDFDAMQIYQMTERSSLHNQDCILSGNFYSKCEQINADTLDVLHKLI